MGRKDTPQMVRLFGVELFGTALANLFLSWGLSLTTGSNAAILQQMEPVYALLLTFLLLGKRPIRTQALATGLIMTGVYWMYQRSNGPVANEPRSWLGPSNHRGKTAYLRS